MMDHIIGESVDLWIIFLDDPTIPMTTPEDKNEPVPKERKDQTLKDKIYI